ncbi:nitroreductase family protein [Paenibacillus turpanensis]|uniref:nitroreductase family protein n=1 Tax=Paenibacillus turpanensis TaxID=2689078 RepID=UPI00140ADE5D|nr:nitroreductase family protein [Paenibacillus turpanensis]
MSVTNPSSILNVMRERRSVKKYEKGKQIPEQVMQEILELAAAAPSAWNLQHWKFILIQDQAMKDKVLPIAYNQQQVSDSSAVVVILADLEANKNAEKIYSEAQAQGMISEEVKNTLIGQIEGAYANVPNIGIIEAFKNSSLAAMQLILAAKAHGIDSCAMGGFDQQGLKELLNIPDRYSASMLISLGYAAKEGYPSGRFSLDELVIRESF